MTITSGESIGSSEPNEIPACFAEFSYLQRINLVKQDLTQVMEYIIPIIPPRCYGHQ